MTDKHQQDEGGSSAVEYGLLVSGIAAVIAVAVYASGGVAADLAHDNCTHITTATSSTNPAACD